MSSRRLVQKLHEFAMLQSRVEKAPGFASALGLGPDTLDSDNHDHENAVTVDKRGGVTLRFPITNESLLPKNKFVSLSTYLAIIDEVTTWALVLGDDKRSRPGKSVSLSLWAGPSSLRGRQPGDQVDVVTTVEKIGNKMGFCNAQVIDAATGGLVCFALHIKYLPMGPFFDTALSSYGWRAATFYADTFLSLPPHQPPPLSEVFDSLEFVTDTTATFDVMPVHASLGGPIHGGCQAVLMEMVGTEVARRTLDIALVALESIHIEYMSPPNSKTVELHAKVLTPLEARDGRVNIRVKLVGDDGKTKSEGVLCFSKGAMNE